MNSRISNILNSNVKNEINKLYTEPMFIAPDGGLDFGLFCREHAYHTYFLIRFAGISTTIKIGHFFIKTPEGITNCSLGSGADHAWCATQTVFPIDLSMTFHLAPDFPNIPKPLIGQKQNGEYLVRYFTDEKDFLQKIDEDSDTCCIYYYEERTFSASDSKLLMEPFCFLLPPSVPGGSWADIYGKDIFAKITFHLYKISLGHIKPLYNKYNSEKLVRYIRSKYKAVMPKLIEILEKSPTKHSS